MTNNKLSESVTDSNLLYFTKWRIVKNALVLSSGFILLFTANDALTMLQSTINRQQGIGVDCQAIIFACFFVSALLLPKYVIQKIGCKTTLVLSMFSFVPILAANFCPTWGVMVPAAILSGFGSSLLWGSQCTFLNEIAVLYAHHIAPKRESVNKPKITQVNLEYGDSIQGKPEKGLHHATVAVCEQFSRSVIQKDENIENRSKSTSNNPSFKTVFSSEKFESPNCYELNTEHSNNLPRRDPEFSRIIDSTTARFFGFHGMAYLSTHVWSNLMSYYMLQKDVIQSDHTSNSTCLCGASFCNVESLCFVQNLEEPSGEVRFILTSTCVAMSVSGVLLVAAFMDSLKTDKRSVRFSFDLLLATFNLTRKKTVLLLIPMSLCVGMMHGFYIGDFTKSFIACAWGTHHIGLVSACYGFACALTSLLSGWMVRRLGRMPIWMLAALVNLVDLVLLLVWQPDPAHPAMFFLVSGMFGLTTGVYWSQIKTLYGILFKEDEEAAFGAHHLWQSFGSCLSFTYSNYLCTSVKLYILLAVSTAAIVGYSVVELSHWPKKR